MIPIHENDRSLIVALLQNEYTSLADDLKEFDAIPAEEQNEKTAKERADTVTAMEHAQYAIDAIVTGKWIILNAEPVCHARHREKGQCENPGRYVPYIIVHDVDKRPIAQVEAQPTIIVCEQHAVNDLDVYFPSEVWRTIQKQVSQQLQGLLLRKDDARLMFLDKETNSLVPPPTTKIATSK